MIPVHNGREIHNDTSTIPVDSKSTDQKNAIQTLQLMSYMYINCKRGMCASSPLYTRASLMVASLVDVSVTVACNCASLNTVLPSKANACNKISTFVGCRGSGTTRFGAGGKEKPGWFGDGANSGKVGIRATVKV